jgi:LysR family transcriptional regulator, cell division regulator
MLSADVRYFLEISTTLNISRAAERLGIAQSSLSMAIKRLEQAMKVPLFARHKKGVLLTPAGKQLLSHAKKLLQDWSDLHDKAWASHHEVQGHFVVGCHTSLALLLAHQFLPPLYQKYDKLSIELQHDISRRITENVTNFAIDIGIVVNPFPHSELISRKLYEDKMMFWSNEKEYDESTIICDPALHQTQVLLKKIKQKGLFFTRMLTSDNLEVIRALTEKGCGIGILPQTVAVKAPTLSPLVHMPNFRDQICVIYRVENKSIRSIQAIVNSITLCAHK